MQDEKLQKLHSAVEEVGTKTNERVAKIEKSVEELSGSIGEYAKTVEKMKEDAERLSGGGEDGEAKKLMSKYRANFMDYTAKGGRSAEAELQAMEKEYRDAWANKLEQADKVQEAKTLRISNDADGGYTIPEEMAEDIVRRIFDFSPVRQAARVSQTGRDHLSLLSRVEDIGINKPGGEQGTLTETQAMKFQENRIPVHKSDIYIHATEEVLSDSGFNLEAEIAREAANKFARDEGTDFVTGTGANEPKGFLSYAAGTNWGQIQQVISGDASALTIDGITDLLYSLERQQYLNNAAFMCNSATWGKIVQLEDGAGNKLPQNYVDLVNMRLLGKPVVIADDMPDIAGSAEPLAVADWQEAYRIVDHVSGMRMKRDDITDPRLTKFYFYRRVGGQVVNFDAVKLQTIST